MDKAAVGSHLSGWDVVDFVTSTVSGVAHKVVDAATEKTRSSSDVSALRSFITFNYAVESSVQGAVQKIYTLECSPSEKELVDAMSSPKTKIAQISIILLARVHTFAAKQIADRVTTLTYNRQFYGFAFTEEKGRLIQMWDRILIGPCDSEELLNKTRDEIRSGHWPMTGASYTCLRQKSE